MIRSNGAIDADQEKLLGLSWMAARLAIGLKSILPNSPEEEPVIAVLRARATASGSKLSSRHLEAAVAVMQSETLKAAADQLFISVHTIRKRVQTIIDRTRLPLRGADELRGWLIAVRDLPGFWSLETRKNGRQSDYPDQWTCL